MLLSKINGNFPCTAAVGKKRKKTFFFLFVSERLQAAIFVFFWLKILITLIDTNQLVRRSMLDLNMSPRPARSVSGEANEYR